MPRTHTHTKRLSGSALTIGILGILTSFGLGIGTADNLRTIDYSAADDASLSGDVTTDGIVNERDVIAILEVAQGYRPATPAELQADPNGNGALTVDDALRILRSLSTR